VARLFRLWQKKRGDRRTGWTAAGNVGEALFFAGLFLLGAISLAALIASQIVLSAGEQLFVSGWLLWLVVLVLISFFLIGGGGVIRSLISVSASVERRAAFSQKASDIDLMHDMQISPKEYPTIAIADEITNSPGIKLAYRLPSAETPIWKLMFSAIFCVAWNAVAASLTVYAVKRHIAGTPDWFLTVFLIPFNAVGVWGIYYFLRQLMLSTGVGPTNVEISEQPLRPGRKYEVFVSQQGKLRMKKLSMTIVCEEEATYRQGTDIRTEIRSVYEQLIFSNKNFEIDPSKPYEYEADLHIPLSAMHSFKSTCNAIRWRLVVRGRGDGHPEFERAFPIVMYPPASQTA